jgi:uncharacterized YigZ family protein
MSEAHQERDSDAPPDPHSFKTPRAVARSELKERGSKFLGFLSPVGTEEEALAFLASIKKRYHDASHHCWAYRLGWGEGLKERCSDAGEPSRTAGPPILASLQSARVTDAAAVVVRYFGGVKLGTAGLVRAYRDSARASVESADLVQRTLVVSIEVEMPYSAQGSFRHLLGRLGLEVGPEAFGESWGAVLRVPLEKVQALEDALGALRESFKGEVRWKSK